MQEYRVIIKTQDQQIVKTVNDFKTENWSELIRKTEQRYDYILTLEERFYLKGNEAENYIKSFQPNKENYMLMDDNLIVGKWEVLAEVNTKYKN